MIEQTLMRLLWLAVKITFTCYEPGPFHVYFIGHKEQCHFLCKSKPPEIAEYIFSILKTTAVNY